MTENRSASEPDAEVQTLRARIGELEAAEAERDRAEHVQRALYRIAETASIAEDQHDFYRRIHEIVGELIYADNFFIALHDAERDMINFPYYVDEVDRDIPDPKLWEPFGIGNAAGGTAYLLRHGEPVFTTPVELERLVASGEMVMVGPPAILYENWLLYTGPVAWLLLLAAYALVRYLESETIGFALAFFGVLAVIVLTRSAYHLVWLAAAVAGVLVVRPRLWRGTVLAALIPLAAATGLYAKNYVAFGAFASSSWLGLSLSKLAVAHVPEPVREDLVAKGVLSPLAMAPSFARPQEYEALIGRAPPTGVPALDFRRKFSGFLNYNHAIYPRASQLLLHDSFAALAHFPKAMAWALMKSVYYFTLAPSDYAFLDANRAKIAGWESAYDLVFYGKVPRPAAAAVVGPMAPESAAAWAQRISPFAIAALGLVAVGGFVLFVSVARRGFRGAPVEVALVFMWGTVLYLSLVCVSVEVFENNRMRFEIEPFLFIGAVAVLARLFGRRLPA